MALDKHGRGEAYRSGETAAAEVSSNDNEHVLKGKEYEEWEAAWAEEVRRREKKWEREQPEMHTLEEFRAAVRARLSSR